MLNNPALFKFYTLIFFAFGGLLGSFSNVVILRMSQKKSVIFPPSACPKCNHRLNALDLVPVFSWLFLRGKCRYCKEPISIQYPLVEAFISLIIGLTFYNHNLSLHFVTQSSALTIWFISSVIFFRNEVQTARPFIWALAYNIALFALFQPTNKTIDTLIILLVITLLTWLITFALNKPSAYKISTISSIAMLWFSPMIKQFYVFLLFLLPAFLSKTKQITSLFFITQVLLILTLLIYHL